MTAIDLYAQLAVALSTGGDRHALLAQLLEPIVQLSHARAGTVHVVAHGTGRPRQIAALQLAPAGAGDEREMVLPLTHRGRCLGEYRLLLAAAVPVTNEIAGLHTTVGALLGLALHDACAEQESRQAVLSDVHDGIAQTLMFVRLRLPLLEEAIVGHDETAALRYCSDVRQAVGSAQTNLRAILTQCRTPMDPKGLKHALQSSVRSFEELTQVNLVFEDHAPNLRLSASQESQVYLIVQEALANIAKHARARHAWLRIDQQGDRVDVLVEDDGAGPPAAAGPASPSHFGIDIMRQRAARLGGEVRIAARSGGGMRMTLSFPIGATAAAAIA